MSLVLCQTGWLWSLRWTQFVFNLSWGLKIQGTRHLLLTCGVRRSAYRWTASSLPIWIWTILWLWPSLLAVVDLLVGCLHPQTKLLWTLYPETLYLLVTSLLSLPVLVLLCPWENPEVVLGGSSGFLTDIWGRFL